jgi:thiamine biosynthesis lipoprotein
MIVNAVNGGRMPSIGRILFLAFIAPCLAAVTVGCRASNAAPERFSYAQIIMGVEAKITLYAANEPEARRIARRGFERMAELDAILSDYRRDSELVRLTMEPPGTRVPISDDLWRALGRACELSRATEGAFDPTVGPVVQQWREARTRGALPTPAAIESAMASVGCGLLQLQPGPPTALLRRDGMRLDLGGIGKGFAADEAVHAMASEGAPSCLVDLGGDLVAGAAPPGEAGWVVRIEPRSDRREADDVLLCHGAVATSGDTEQFMEVDGQRYSHVVDPRTGWALTSRIAVAVLAADGATADALASAMCVLGPEAGRRILERSFRDVTVMWDIWTPGRTRRTWHIPSPAMD